MKVFNKYSRELLQTCNKITLKDENRIYENIERAKEEIKILSYKDRSDILYNLKQLLEKNFDSFVEIISKEAGKPYHYSQSEVSRSIDTIHIGAIEALQSFGEVIACPNKNFENKTNQILNSAFTTLEAKGAVIAIAPFNFPLNLALHKIIPAIVVGAPIVIKPSPYTPLTLLKFLELIKRTKLPKDFVQVLICDNELAERMVRSENFSIFSFTGSPQVGWLLKSQAGKKKCILELGGNAAVIVDRLNCQQLDLESIISSLVNASFLYSGQICISTQRILVSEFDLDIFVKMFVEKVMSLCIGNPNDKNQKVIVGPLIDKDHLNRIHNWVQLAMKEGAKVLSGGEIFSVEHNIFEPTVLLNVSHDSLIYKNEAFGPVVIIETYQNFNEAVNIVNDSDFGLQAGIFSDSLRNIKYAYSELKVGGVIVNSPAGYRMDHMPYGGIKNSGLGREGIRNSILEYCEQKLIIF